MVFIRALVVVLVTTALLLSAPGWPNWLVVCYLKPTAEL